MTEEQITKCVLQRRTRSYIIDDDFIGRIQATQGPRVRRSGKSLPDDAEFVSCERIAGTRDWQVTAVSEKFMPKPRGYSSWNSSFNVRDVSEGDESFAEPDPVLARLFDAVRTKGAAEQAQCPTRQ